MFKKASLEKTRFEWREKRSLNKPSKMRNKFRETLKKL